MSDLCINSVGVYIPEGRLYCADLLKNNKLDPVTASEQNYVSLYNENSGKSISDMAFIAAQDALKKSSLKAADIDLVIFSNLFFRDKLCWSVSSSVCNRLNIEGVEFLDIYQGCNGVLSSIDIVMSRFALNDKYNNALILTAELFPDEFVEKWNCDFSVSYGDAAGAFIISRDCGYNRIKSFSSSFFSSINDLIYVPNVPELKFDLKKSKTEFFDLCPVENIQKTFKNGNNVVIDRLLTTEKLTLDDISYFILTNYGEKLLSTTCLEAGIPINITTAEFGYNSGHLGCADPIINFYHALNTGKIQKGDNVIFLIQGAGASAMGLLVNI